MFHESFMDISTATTIAGGVKTPESEPEPPTRIQPSSKPLSFTNGVLKRHPSLHRNQAAAVVAYKECLKNHAATMGGHAVDGCCEFMPSPAADPADPTSLKCAACGCHRNFHRRDPEYSPPPQPPSISAPQQHLIEYQPHHRHHPPPPINHGGKSSPNSASPPPISSSYYPSAPHMLLALSAGVSGPPPENNPPANLTPHGRKRFRSKFTADQKQRMLEFAEKIGWKMQRRDDDSIADFCGGVGVEKGVFKVWMHNHKNNFGKRDDGNNTTNNNGAIGNNYNHHENESSVSAHVVAANGSSSSS